MTWLERLWARLRPYLISPIGRPAKLRAITYFAANRPRHLLIANRYPRQIIGVGIRLPDMSVRYKAHPAPEQVKYPVLSIVWAKPHGAGRWKR
jgi:hypothetical protein